MSVRHCTHRPGSGHCQFCEEPPEQPPEVPCRDCDEAKFHEPQSDDAELAAIRETVTNCDCMCAEAGQALLRMVDELTVQLSQLEHYGRQCVAERDELRAKLAERELALDRKEKELLYWMDVAERAEKADD